MARSSGRRDSTDTMKKQRQYHLQTAELSALRPLAHRPRKLIRAPRNGAGRIAGDVKALAAARAKIGERENVAGIDFASMYPSLMIKRNISPETVLCSCCRNIAVPEAGYNICEKRRGLIPLTLEPLVERRKVYKQMTKSADERTRAIYGARRAAMKWMLVTCFGYMGFLSSGGLAKLRQEMTFHLVYMQMTKPSHIGVAGELLRKVTLSRKSLLHTRDNACALDLPFFPTCAFR